MNSKIRLIFILTLCLGLFGTTVMAQDDAEETPEPEATAETMDMDDPSVVDIVHSEIEGPASFVRFLHFVPGDTSVDVYIDGEPSDTQGLGFMDSGNWIVVPAGSHNVSVTVAGDTPENAFWTSDVSLPENEPVIVAVVGNSDTDTPTVLLVTDDYGEVLPSVGTINFINAMSDDVGVNLLRDDVVFIAGVQSPEGDVVEINNSIPVDTGEYTFSLTVAGTDQAVENASVELDVRDEDNYLLVATGTQQDPHLLVYETPQAQVDVMRGEIEAPGTVIDVLRARGYDDVLTAIEDAGLTDTLNGDGFFTVFVPADHRIDELAQLDDIATVLQNHVVDGDYRSSDFNLSDGGTITTVAGNTLPFGVEGNTLVIDGIHVLDVNWMATNGVIHLIDGVLAP